MIRTFRPENLPHSHLQPLSPLLADRIVLTGILYLTEYKRNMSRFRPPLHAPKCIYFGDPVGALQGNTRRYLLVISNHFLSLGESSIDGHGTDKFYFNASFRCPYWFLWGHVAYGHPFTRPVSIALMPTCIARLTTVYEAVKTQTGPFTTIQFIFTAGKTVCGSAHRANLFLPFSVILVALRTGCFLFALELLSQIKQLFVG